MRRWSLETTARRVIRPLQRRGLPDEGTVDPLWETEPLLASITTAAIPGQVANGARAGQRLRRTTGAVGGMPSDRHPSHGRAQRQDRATGSAIILLLWFSMAS